MQNLNMDLSIHAVGRSGALVTGMNYSDVPVNFGALTRA